jgi:hypothetical protein
VGSRLFGGPGPENFYSTLITTRFRGQFDE